MFVARELKDKNICEYLLYMWQVEDTIRAFGLDIDRIEQEYLAKFQLDEASRKQELQWFADLIAMMREEGKQEKDHLQMNNGTVILLSDLHAELLRSPKHPFYSAAYYKALPYIVELRAKGGGDKPEIETCLDALYGVMLLRLQGREVSAETTSALQSITHLLAMLSDAYKKDKAGELEM